MKIYKAIKDCHAIGLNSIVLEQNGNKLIRMFYTKPHHVLWKNKNVFSKDLSIALHSHHCDIEIQVIYGNITNITANVKNDYNGNIKGWRYESPIKNKDGSFLERCNFALKDIKKQLILPNETIGMYAKQIHTVYVEQGKEVGWIIREGDEDPKYDNTCYSNNDLTSFNFDDHYKPLEEEEVDRIIQLLKRKEPEFLTLAL